MIGPALLLAITISVPIQTSPQHPEARGCGGMVQALSTTADSAPLQSRLDAEGTAILHLPATGPWRVSLISDRCWAPPVSVQVDEGSSERLGLRVWRKGELRGELAPSRHTALPESVEIRMWPAAQSVGDARTEPLAVVSCSLSEGRWRCPGPMIDLDLRLTAADFAPAYFWNVSFADGSATLPRTVLEPGASLTGWVIDAKGEPASGAQVRLAPEQINEVAGRAAGASSRTMTVQVNGRGFFQFGSISPGSYVVTARTADRAAATVLHVNISEAREYVLGDALALEPPATVEVHVQPARAPDGAAWSIQLERVVAADRLLVEAAAGQVNENGRWIGDGLERGAYLLKIVDRSGSVVSRRDLEIDREFLAVTVAVGQISISGRIRVGTDPIAAALKFDSPAGTVRIRSDDDGRFEGSLPRDGRWNVEITPTGAMQRVRARVDVSAALGASAEVDIELPGSRIEGIVTDEAGDRVPEAEILVLRSNAVAANAGTDPKGEFSIVGVDPGAIVLVAKKGELSSEPHPYLVSSGSSTKTTLVLRAPDEIRVRLVRQSGRPIAGALIRYLAQGEILSTVSGPDGTFSLTLPSGAPFADVVIVAPNAPVKVERVDVSRDGAVLTVADLGAVLAIRLPANSKLPFFARGAIRLPVSLLLYPREGFGPPRELVGDKLYLHIEPGSYAVCYQQQTECVSVTAQPGHEASVEPRNTPGGGQE